MSNLQQELPVETTTAIVGIGGKKDLILEKESMQEFVIDKEIKVVEKDDQKTEIPEIEIFKIGVIKDWIPESKITTTSSVDVASESPSYIFSPDDTKQGGEYQKRFGQSVSA